MTLRRPVTLLALLLFSSIATAGPAWAQSIWLPRDQERGLLLEVLHTRMEFYDMDSPMGCLYLGGRVALRPTVALVAEVPYIRTDAWRRTTSGFLVTYKGESVGNPYLGIELRPSASDFFLELGARVPLMSEDEPDAELVGRLADQGRFDAFAASTLPIHLVFNIRHVTDAGLLTRLRFGPVLAIPTENEGFQDIELHAEFGWQVGYEGRTARVGGALTGQSLLTENSPPVGVRTRTQFEFHADFGSWTIRPGLDVRLPIGSYANEVSIVYGGSLGASF